MKVFEVISDVENFQSLGLVDSSLWSTSLLTFDGRPKAKDWIRIQVYRLSTIQREGDFFYLSPGVLVASARRFEEFRTYFEQSGEVLELYGEAGEIFYALNILQCSNALDPENTLWKVFPRTGKKSRIVRYAFNEDRFFQPAIFKIPETVRSAIYVKEDAVRDPLFDFHQFYIQRDLQGLEFRIIWSKNGLSE